MAKHRRKHKPTIGSISHGTMRDEDLIPCFLDEIKRIDPARITKLRKDPAWKKVTDKLGETNGRYFLPFAFTGLDGVITLVTENEIADYTAELFDILNELAPPYCSFGSSEGDGSDYGFWPDFETAKENVEFISAPPKWNRSEQEGIDIPPKGFKGEWLSINDHGNVTLYYRNSKGQDKEIWSVV